MIPSWKMLRGPKIQELSLYSDAARRRILDLRLHLRVPENPRLWGSWTIGVDIC
jgi:hypothetical protein